jgi:hypothetical protein
LANAQVLANTRRLTPAGSHATQEGSWHRDAKERQGFCRL